MAAAFWQVPEYEYDEMLFEIGCDRAICTTILSESL